MSRFVKGVVWSGVDKFVGQGINFIIGLIIARQLSPEDYGVFGIISVVIAISAIFVDSGFSTALIQKKNRDNNDYNTTFCFNLSISIALYIFIFLLSPSLSKFYSEPILISSTRIAALTIIINAISLVHVTQLVVKLDFKKQSKISIVSSLLSGVAGMFLAYNGYGLWALVLMTLIRSIINTILLCIQNKWIPKIDFQMDRFKPLFRFSSKIMLTALINTFFNNLYVLIIGKKFSVATLGYYTRATQITNFSVINFTDIIQRVSFPILSEIQEEKDLLVQNHTKLIKASSYLLFPILTVLIFLAEPLVELILTKKWLESVWMIQLLCIASLLHTTHSLNLNLLNVIGRPDLFLKIEFLKKLLIVLILAATLPYGVFSVIIGQIIVSIVSLFINTHHVGKLLGYPVFDQIKDLSKNIFANLILAAFLYFILNEIEVSILKIVTGVISSIIIYTVLSILMKLEGYKFILQHLKNFLVK